MQDFERRIARVRDDREHGSRWLVREAIAILYDLANSTAFPQDKRIHHLQRAGNELVRARPAMTAIAGAVIRILGASENPGEIAHAAEQLLKEYDTAIERITAHARPLLSGTLMAHSLSGTVLETLTACASQIEQVIVLEGRPRYEGREVALALHNKGIATTLITDAQADIFLSRCHAVVVGADSILANGDILNKAGTALLAWAARGHKVPLYVLCETLKIASDTWTGDIAQLEEKEAGEVWEQIIRGITIHNFYFDHTPAMLVTKVITEQGTLARRDIQKTASTLRRMSKHSKLAQTS
ncbi:MAG: ribose 1,5-bisphosphate isomerase [Ktedonobacteraceae bacterium]